MAGAFDEAFNLLKMNHFTTTYGPQFVLDAVVKAIGGPEVERMRNYVLMHGNHPHPEVRQSVEDVYQHLTALASGRMTPKPKMMDAQQLAEMQAQVHMPQQGEPMQSVPASVESDKRQMPQDGTPMQKAMRVLVNSHFAKALPEQQMFVERTRRDIAGGADDEEYEYGDYPEIDRFGARSLGTVHPAILGMLQRRTEDYHQTRGVPPTLNLDAGRDEDRRMSSEHGIFRNMPGRDERQGMTIAQGPLFNERGYDREKGYR